MKHAFLGAGGLGGFLAGALARAGLPVALIVRGDALGSYPHKLTVSSRVLGDFEVPIEVSAELLPPIDVVWITVKAIQLDAALAAVPPDRIGNALIVPLLNGVDHMARLRSRYPPKQVIAGTIRVESERVAPGRIRQLSPFADIRLAAAGPLGNRVHALVKEVRGAGLRCEVVEDEASLLWGKLAFLAPLALTTTAKGAPLGQVRDDPVWRARLEAAASEACAVAQMEGAQIDPAAVLDLLMSGPDGMKSSMQKDVEAGRRSELDAIGGPIVRLGHAHGIDAPATQELMEMVAAVVS